MDAIPRCCYILPIVDLVVPTNIPAMVILISNLVVVCVVIKRKSSAPSSLREKQIINDASVFWFSVFTT